MSFLKNSINLEIVLENKQEEEIIGQDPAKTEKMPLYKVEEIVQGYVKLDPKHSKNIPHKGIDIQIEGYIESLNEKLKFPFAKQTVQLEQEGIIDNELILSFKLSEFTRPIETCENYFGRVRYVVKAIVHRNFFSQIEVEKEIGIQLNYFRPSIPRLYRLMITCHGEPSLTYQQDKREYFATESIIGKIDIEPEAPKLKILYVQLIRRDEFRMLPGFFLSKTEEEMVDFIDLSTELKKALDSEVKSIPLKVSLAKYNLPPSGRYQGPKLFFAISYLLKIKFEEETGRKWSKEVKIPIRRDS